MTHEFTKDEWRDIYHAFFPAATEAEYDAAWEEFQAAKRAHLAKMAIQ